MNRPTLEELGYVPDRYGVIERLLVHELEQGGTLAFATGIQGCGKTTMELHMALAAMLQGEVVIWRGRHVDSWHAFPGPVKIWSNYPIHVLRAPLSGGRLETWTEPVVHHFDTIEELLERMEPGCLNVVYADESIPAAIVVHGVVKTVRFWDAVVSKLSQKLTTTWHTLVVDEFHEVWWSRPQGEDYHRQQLVVNALADFRKSFNSLVGASHHVDECDHRILAKFQFQLYGRGAKPKNGSRVAPVLTLQLAQGAFIVDSLYFCELAFPKIPKPPFQLFVRRADDVHVDDVVDVQEAGAPA